MAIAIRYEPMQAGLEAADNAGRFATEQAVYNQQLRERAFQEDQARGAASFALGGMGQAFNQHLQVNDRNFRDQQAAAQDQYRRDALNTQLQRSMIGAQAGLDRTAMSQEGAYDRALLGAGSRESIAGMNNATREGIAGANIQSREQIAAARIKAAEDALGRKLTFDEGKTIYLQEQQNQRQQAGFQQQNDNREDTQEFQAGQNAATLQSRGENTRRMVENSEAVRTEGGRRASIQEQINAKEAVARQIADQIMANERRAQGLGRVETTIGNIKTTIPDPQVRQIELMNQRLRQQYQQIMEQDIPSLAETLRRVTPAPAIAPMPISPQSLPNAPDGGMMGRAAQAMQMIQTPSGPMRMLGNGVIEKDGKRYRVTNQTGPDGTPVIVPLE